MNSQVSAVWSRRFWPTAGRWWIRGMLREASISAGPMPERRRMCGVSKLPAERMTSFFARTILGTSGPACIDGRSSTPVALLPSNSTFAHIVLVTIDKLLIFERDRESRYAVALVVRTPLSTLNWAAEIPSGLPSLWSGLMGWPASSPASKQCSITGCHD